MSIEEITRIETTMNNLVTLTREQNSAMNKMVETLTEMRTIQTNDSKRIDKLESDKTWLNRSIIALFIAATFTLITTRGSKSHELNRYPAHQETRRDETQTVPVHRGEDHHWLWPQP